MFAERSLFLFSIFTDPIYFLQYTVIIIISITLHELGHGVAAISQGDNTPKEAGHMTLDPVVHMGVPSLIILACVGMAWGEMPVRPHRFKDGSTGRIIVSAAGPMTNFTIAAASIAFAHLLLSQFIAPYSVLNFLYLAAVINVSLGIFNLLPIPPLDGFTVCSEFFPSLKPIAKHPSAPAIFFVLFFLGGFSAIGMGASFIVNWLM